MQANCPICDDPLDTDPDGGYCERCREYWLIETLQELADEEDDPRNAEGSIILALRLFREPVHFEEILARHFFFDEVIPWITSDK